MQTRPLFTPCDRKRKQFGVSHAMDSAHTELLQHVQADVVIMELAESYDEITSSMAFEALHDLNDTPGAFSSVLASHRLSRASLLLRQRVSVVRAVQIRCRQSTGGLPRTTPARRPSLLGETSSSGAQWSVACMREQRPACASLACAAHP